MHHSSNLTIVGCIGGRRNCQRPLEERRRNRRERLTVILIEFLPMIQSLPLKSPQQLVRQRQYSRGIFDLTYAHLFLCEPSQIMSQMSLKTSRNESCSLSLLLFNQYSHSLRGFKSKWLTSRSVPSRKDMICTSRSITSSTTITHIEHIPINCEVQWEIRIGTVVQLQLRFGENDGTGRKEESFQLKRERESVRDNRERGRGRETDLLRVCVF